MAHDDVGRDLERDDRFLDVDDAAVQASGRHHLVVLLETGDEGAMLVGALLLRAHELAKPGGLVALVLPSGVLANERLRDLRAELLERCTLLAAIALPRGTFRKTGTSAACGILLLRNTPAPPGHRVFFAMPERLEELPDAVAAYRGGLRIADCGLQIGRRASQSTIFNLQSTMGYWLAQTPALAQRLDPAFWRPEQRALLDRLAARHPLRPLGELIEVRCASGHHAAVIRADVPHPDIVAHDEEDVGFCRLRLRRLGGGEKRGRG